MKLSDELILDARTTSKLTERSIAGQIEFWARLGRCVEELLSGHRALALKKTGDQRPLSELIATVNQAEGRERLDNFLKTQPFPHYQVADGKPGFLVRIDEDGTRTLGKFINRQFQTVKEETATKSKTRSKTRSKGRK